MHLDSRGYAYETYREGGRVCRRYVGSGECAALLVRLDEHDRDRAQEKRRDELAKVERLSSGSDALEAFCAACDALFRAAMKARGFHQHKRGAWRKRRKNIMAKTTQALETTKAPDSEHLALLKRANNGDKIAAAQALAQVKGQPEEGPMLELLASFSEVAREALLRNVTDNELRRAGFRRQLEVTRDELAGPKPSSLELHLAERVALCALAVARLEAVFMKTWIPARRCGKRADGSSTAPTVAI